MQINDLNLTLCDNIYIRCNAGIWTCCKVSRNTKGIICYGNKEDIEISQRNKIVWFMLSKME
jgi:hypothetical protein